MGAHSFCEPCPEGQFSFPGSFSCSNCPPGQYIDGFTNKVIYKLAVEVTCLDCDAGSYSTSGGFSCLPCDQGSYSSKGSAACVQCPEGYYSESSNECICPAGSYLSGSLPVSCEPCPLETYSQIGMPSCLPCPSGSYVNDDSSDCIICPEGQYLPDGLKTCLDCPPGTWSNSSAFECIVCTEDCESCASLTECDKCNANAQKNTDGSCTVTEQDEYPDPDPDPEWKTCEVDWNCEECDKSGCIACKSGFMIKNETGISTCVDPSLLPENPDNLQSTPMEDLASAATASSSLGLSTTGVAAKVINPGSSTAFGFGVVAKVIRNARYFNIAYSNQTQNSFAAEESESNSFIPAPDSIDSKDLHETFRRYDVEPNFLINYWSNIIPIIVVSCVLVALKVLKTYLTRYKENEKIEKIQKLIKSVQVSASNYLVTNAYGSFDEIILYFVLEMQTIKFDSGLSSISFFSAFLFLGIGLAFFVFHFYVLKRYQTIKAQIYPEENETKGLEKFKEDYSHVKIFFKDFKDDSLSQQAFLAFLMLRSGILNIVLCLCVNYPLAEAVLFMIVNVVFAVFLVLKRPFEEFMGALAQYFCEMIVLITYTGVLILTILDEKGVGVGADSRESLETMIVTLGIVLNVGGVVFQCIGIGDTVFGILKDLRARQKQKSQIAPIIAAKALDNLELTFTDKTTAKNILTISDNDFTGALNTLDLSSTRSTQQLVDRGGGGGGLMGLPSLSTKISNKESLERCLEIETLPSKNNLLTEEGSQNDLDRPRTTTNILVLVHSETILEEESNSSPIQNEKSLAEDKIEKVLDETQKKERYGRKLNKRKDNFSFGGNEEMNRNGRQLFDNRNCL